MRVCAKNTIIWKKGLKIPYATGTRSKNALLKLRKKCDKILLMKDGEIIEEGNHNELIEKQGEYYNLVSAS